MTEVITVFLSHFTALNRGTSSSEIHPELDRQAGQMRRSSGRDGLGPQPISQAAVDD